MTVLYFNSSVHAVATTALGGFKLWRRMSTRPLFDKDGEEGKPVEVPPEVPQTLSSRNALSFTLACTYTRLAISPVRQALPQWPTLRPPPLLQTS